MEFISNLFTALLGGIVATAFGSFFILWIFLMIISALIGLALFVFWIIALVDCAKRDDKDFAIGGKNAKLIWILLLVFIRSIVPIIYYILIMRNKETAINENDISQVNKTIQENSSQ